MCCCCGSTQLIAERPISNAKALIDAWRLSPYEVNWLDRREGTRCAACGFNLRAMCLASAIMRCAGFTGLLKDFIYLPAIREKRVLEINPSLGVSQFLSQLPNHVLGSYPQVDIHALPFPDQFFDWVVHSETLEHVKHPVRALSECRRVLKPGGYCIFTVPLIPDRMTMSREGLPPSYHGGSTNPANPIDVLVYTEYGADAWKQVIQAGFAECRFVVLEYPAAISMVAVN